MPHLLHTACALLACCALTTANVEKTIFLGPSPVTLPNGNHPPSLYALARPLAILSPLAPILPTRLPVTFASSARPRGLDSWYLVRGLHPGTRYEVRVCWPATQPTDFWLDAHPLSHIVDSPALAASLAHYSHHVQHASPKPQHDDEKDEEDASTVPQSLVFLHVQAAASYYSINRTLMEFPPPVDVDLILDPFLLNILPRSLAPVALYITAVAIGAWFLSAYIYRSLLALATQPPTKPHTD